MFLICIYKNLVYMNVYMHVQLYTYHIYTNNTVPRMFAYSFMQVFCRRRAFFVRTRFACASSLAANILFELTLFHIVSWHCGWCFPFGAFPVKMNWLEACCSDWLFGRNRSFGACKWFGIGVRPASNCFGFGWVVWVLLFFGSGDTTLASRARRSSA